MNHEPDGLTLRPDDPRLSEWIDGRLPAAEAAAVARSVAAAPELARVVADLRRVKALLAAAPGREPPAGFVADVLAAVDAPPRLAAGTTAGGLGGPADCRVDAEWERIELERIATEIAEAREDAAVAETIVEPPARWPWMTMLAALAAGMLVTVFVNMPPLHSVLVEKDRDVALRGQEHPQDGLTRSVDAFLAENERDAAASEASDAAKRAEDPGAAVAGGVHASASVAASGGKAPEAKRDQSMDDRANMARRLGAATTRPVEKERTGYGPAGAPPRPETPPQVAVPGEPAAEQLNVAALDKQRDPQGKPGAGKPGALRDEAGGSDALARLDAKRLPNAADSSAVIGGGGGGGGTALRGRVALLERLGEHRVATEPVVVVVRGREGRAEFAALLAARTISITRAEEGRKHEEQKSPSLQVDRSRPPGGENLKEAVPAEAGPVWLGRGGRDAVEDADGDADGDDKPSPAKDAPGGDELIALTGSPAAIDDLIASLEGRGLSVDRRSLKSLEKFSYGWAADGSQPGIATESSAGEAKRGEKGRSGKAEKALPRQAADGASAPSAASSPSGPTTVTLLVRLVDIGPAEPVAGTATAAGTPAAPTAPAKGVDEAHGAGEQGAGDRKEP